MQLPKVILLRQNGRGPATVPLKQHADDAGYDIFCVEDKWILPFSCVDIETGWDIKIPDKFWGSIQSRSSTFKRRRLIVFGGVMDPNYTGKLSVLIWNPFFWPKKIKMGERLAQLVIHPVYDMKFSEVVCMPFTTRGRNSFGSTGA